MLENRRQFLRTLGMATAVGACATEAQAFGPPTVSPDSVGVLLDTAACVGCRLCEYACKQANGLPTGTLESYNDTSVFAQMRRPSPTALTVVNEWKPQGHAPLYAKVNCMHCNETACV